MTTAIIVLNWNGWRQTIHCLESLLRTEKADFRIVICDNDSRDGSVNHLLAWAAGDISVWTSPAHPLHGHTMPPAPKPLGITVLDASSKLPPPTEIPGTVLIKTGGNLGYAGGNNVGIAWALQDPRCDSFWILNNDTIISPTALAAFRADARARPEIGLWGGLIGNYDAPDTIQALGGGTYGKFWSGKGRLLSSERKISDQFDARSIERRLEYITGACIFATRAFIEQIGPMEDKYFLYYEELDWARRAKSRFGLGFCPEAKVWHMESLTINPRMLGIRPKPSRISEYFIRRNRVLFARKVHPPLVPVLLATYWWTARKRRRQNRLDEAEIIDRVLHDFRTGQTTRPGSDFFSPRAQALGPLGSPRRGR